LINDAAIKPSAPKEGEEVHASPDKHERYIEQECSCLHEQLYPLGALTNPSLITFTVLLRNLGRQILHNSNTIGDSKTILP
jgi:hypothetical protein